MTGFIVGNKLFSFSNCDCKPLMFKQKYAFCCFQLFKDNNLKANHKNMKMKKHGKKTVFNGSKILI